MSEQTKNINPTENKKGKGNKVLLCIVGIIGIFVITWIFSPSSPKAASEIHDRTETQRPLQGTIQIDDSTNWPGVTIDQTECVDATIRTRDVIWEVRLDMDNNRKIPMFPGNWGDTNSTLKVPEKEGAFKYEWRIRPGQPIRNGVIAYAIHKKTEPHRFGTN